MPAWLPPQPKGGSARTGPLPLHPMSVSDILDGAIKLLRANARTMLLIVATFMVPLEFILAFLQRNVNGGKGIFDILKDPTAASAQNDPSTTFALAAVTYLTFWIVVPLVCGGASRVVMTSYLGGELGAKEAIFAALRRAPALIAATLVVHVLELIAGVACVIPALFLMPMFMMTAPAIAIEELGPIAGIRRSVRLARRRYWPTVGIALLSGVLAYFLDNILGLIPNLIGLVIGLHWGWVLIAAGGVLEAFVTVPLITIVATLVYLDARIRQEGFDLQVIAAGLEADGARRTGTGDG